MQAPAWIGLFQLIPPEHYDNLAIQTMGGAEITVQALLRLEADYIVLKGRATGTTEAGKVFFVPYDQINYLNFLKPVREAEVEAIFAAAPQMGETTAVPAPPPADGASETQALPAEPAPQPAAPPAAPAAAADNDATVAISKPALPGKAALLERLRARSGPSTPKPSDK
jgi:hypothetical protein